jgi:hypothetical protein
MQEAGRWLWQPLPWIAGGLVFLALGLALQDGPRSPLWWGELPLHLMLIAGVLAPGRFYLPLSRRIAPVALVVLSWAFGMAYEMTLTVDGTGIGGVHPDTRASFLLAQGDYILIALATLALVRWLRLDLRLAFFLAAGKSLTEGLVFTGVLWGAGWSAPLALAYYALAYASFIALPLVLVDPRLVWSGPAPSRLRVAAIWATGFAVAFAIRIAWGLGWAPLATWLWDLPPNPISA